MAERKKVFIVKIPPEARGDLDKLMERLSKALAGDPVLIHVKGDMLRVEVYGGSVLARRTKLGIKRVLSEMASPAGKGRLRLSRSAVYRAAGVAIPLDVLELVLAQSGYYAVVEGEELVTNASMDTVHAYARSIGVALSETAGLEATRTSKKFIAVIAAFTGASVMEVVDLGFKTGLLEEDDDGKLRLTVDWREAVKRALSKQRSGGVGFGAGGAEEDI